MRNIILFFLISLLFSCNEKPKDAILAVGSYRGWLDIQDNQKLPFVFDVDAPNLIKIYNAEEIIDVDEITYKNDSVYIKLPVFEGYITAKISEDKSLEGYFVKEGLNRIVPFKAESGYNQRFDSGSKSYQDVTGIWEATFSEGIVDSEYKAKGIFKQKGNKIEGTFRTTTGDYRYLEGIMDGKTMKLSTFDGAHAFLFTAKVTDSTMEGTFYSGNHFKEPFVAKRNTAYELPSANDLTFLKEDYDGINFTFPDSIGNMVSLKDERFKDKVVVVQIMGTWCPNCLDESKYYAEFYKKNKDKDLEIIALAFEYAKTKEEAFSRIERLKTRIGIGYPVLLAQYGTSSKTKAQEKLPMLNHVLSYPTSIFIDKTGEVRKIHTGFNGPATGEKYTEFMDEFEGFVGGLLRE